MKAKEKGGRILTLYLSPADAEMLSRLEKASGDTASAILRAALRHQYVTQKCNPYNDAIDKMGELRGH